MTNENKSIGKFFEEREIMIKARPKKVKVIISEMTKEEARHIFQYRPHSKYSESRFGGNEYSDDKCLLLNGDATFCKMCGSPTANRYLIKDVCPDCDGRSEYHGTDPHKGN